MNAPLKNPTWELRWETYICVFIANSMCGWLGKILTMRQVPMRRGASQWQAFAGPTPWNINTCHLFTGQNEAGLSHRCKISNTWNAQCVLSSFFSSLCLLFLLVFLSIVLSIYLSTSYVPPSLHHPPSVWVRSPSPLFSRGNKMVEASVSHLCFHSLLFKHKSCYASYR